MRPEEIEALLMETLFEEREEGPMDTALDRAVQGLAEEARIKAEEEK